MHAWGVAAALGVLLGCGGGGGDDGGGGPTPAPAPGPSQTVMVITDTGLSPRSITVQAGAQVVFRNDGSRPHQLSSDPHPEHTQCPEYNSPVLQQGELFVATAQARSAPCGLHDHLNPGDSALRGQVTVTGG